MTVSILLDMGRSYGPFLCFPSIDARRWESGKETAPGPYISEKHGGNEIYIYCNEI